MQFFYIDYMNNGKKERNIGFLRVENSGFCVGLRGVPQQCGDRCKVYAVDSDDEKILMGIVPIKDQMDPASEPCALYAGRDSAVWRTKGRLCAA